MTFRKVWLRLRLKSLHKLWIYSITGITLGIILSAGLFVYASYYLPSPGKLISADNNYTTKIYDKKGVLLYSLYKDENRTYITLDHIPKYVQQGTIAIEDKHFYENAGFSIIGIIRALRNTMMGYGLSGGSTISQQLVKNVLLTPERTLQRKIKELILSIEVNQIYSKKQILELYLNDVGYGGPAVGVQAAAQQYFGKDIEKLDLAESAFIAGLPQSPTYYSPFSGNKYYIKRTESVLKEMAAEGYISSKQKSQALEEIKKYKFSPHDMSIKAPHFVMYVRDLLVKQFGEDFVETGGLQVTTSLDYDIQKHAEEIVKTEISKLKAEKVSNGACIVRNAKNGQILAMVGSADYFDTSNDGNFNAALASRQPGSSLKPITYITAFQKGYTPASMLMDSRTNFQANSAETPYIPVNYDGTYHGPVQIRFALGNSLNVPAVKMLAKVGIGEVMDNAYKMGIKNWQPTEENIKQVGLSLVLGGRETNLLDETTAFGVFANDGIRHDPAAILKVTDPKGKILYEYKQDQGKKVFSKELTFLISHILLDNNARSMAFGASSWLNVTGKTVAVKTGTTDEKRDNWTIGYTPTYVVGVWVGNNNNKPMNQTIASGITGASPIWNKVISYVLKGKNDEPFKKPDNVNAMQIDSLFGGLPAPEGQTRAEYFLKGTEPTAISGNYKNQDGKLYYSIHEDDPVSNDGINRWQTGIEDWIHSTHSAADWQWYPPGNTIGQPITPTLFPTQFISPTLPYTYHKDYIKRKKRE